MSEKLKIHTDGKDENGKPKAGGAMCICPKCIAESDKPCEHKNTFTLGCGYSFLLDDVEICKDCGMSRSIHEQGQSAWLNVDLKKQAIDIIVDASEVIMKLKSMKG